MTKNGTWIWVGQNGLFNSNLDRKRGGPQFVLNEVCDFVTKKVFNGDSQVLPPFLNIRPR